MLKPERKKLLQELVESDTPLKTMQKEYGFNYKTVRKYYPKYRSGAPHRRSTQQISEIIESSQGVIESMEADGAPLTAIAAAIGIDHRTLSRRHPELGWTREESARFASMVSKLTRIKEF